MVVSSNVMFYAFVWAQIAYEIHMAIIGATGQATQTTGGDAVLINCQKSSRSSYPSSFTKYHLLSS